MSVEAACRQAPAAGKAVLGIEDGMTRALNATKTKHGHIFNCALLCECGQTWSKQRREPSECPHREENAERKREQARTRMGVAKQGGKSDGS